MKSTIFNLSKQVLLVILDGYGINQNTNKNAVKDAATPNLDTIFSTYPYTTIEAGGVAVGLPKGISGNSEVGHMNIGAGRPVRQDLVRINESIEKNKFKDLDLFKSLIQTTQSSSKRLHLIGLLSDGGVHSHFDHLKYIIQCLKLYPNIKVFFHAFMDGRDTQKDSGINYLEEIQKIQDTFPNFVIASICGRSIGMDRDQRWEKIEQSYNVLIGLGPVTKITPVNYIQEEYAQGRFDEFIAPTSFHLSENFDGKIEPDDCAFFLNFRPDRAIQITLALTDPNFNHFSRTIVPKYFLCMTPYIQDLIKLPILFDKEPQKGGLSEYLSAQKLKQFKIAETEKYAHITYFFNGGQKAPFTGENQCLIPSPKEVETYDQKPEMSAHLVTEKLISALDDQDVSFFLVNYANSDMVGHTGNYQAALKAVETLDQCMKQVYEKCISNEITLIITADHGNSDQMEYENGKPHTSHTGAKVPLCIVHKDLDNQVQINGKHFALKDIAPTIVFSLGLDRPKTFSGKNIFQ